MTKKKGKDIQQAEWENRLAFLDGVIQVNKPEIMVTSPKGDADMLVPPVSTETTRRVNKRIPPRKSRVRQQQRRAQSVRPMVASTDKQVEARETVKARVLELQNEVLKENMTKIALQLYREGRELISTLDAGTDSDFFVAAYYIKATVEAFCRVQRYKDAAEVLLYFVKWMISALPANTIPISYAKDLVKEARAYIDPQVDRVLLKRCDDLDFALVTINTD